MDMPLLKGLMPMTFKNSFFSLLKKVFKDAPELESVGFWINGKDLDYSINEEDIILNGKRWDEYQDELGVDNFSRIKRDIDNIKEKLKSINLDFDFNDLLENVKNKQLEIYNSSNILKAADTLNDFFIKSWKLKSEKDLKEKRALLKFFDEDADVKRYNYIVLNRKLELVEFVEGGKHYDGN